MIFRVFTHPEVIKPRRNIEQVAADAVDLLDESIRRNKAAALKLQEAADDLKDKMSKVKGDDIA